MKTFLALLAYLAASGTPAEHVRLPGPGGTMLDAALVRPAAADPSKPAVVALHGCGGPYAERDGQWAAALAKAGHAVLLPDSFGSRGLESQCRVKDRTVRPERERRDDAIAAGAWLRAQPGVAPGGIVLMGWSNGGQTVLATAKDGIGLPPGLFLRYVAFYPGCAAASRDEAWRPAAPVLALVGELDDWTPVAPCKILARRVGPAFGLIIYPDAYHDFDAPNRAVRVLSGLPNTLGGVARAGTNPAAREDALTRVPGWIATGR
jgi:dienelactone hydrolase